MIEMVLGQWFQVRAGQIDYDQFGLPPTAHEDLSRQFGVKKGGTGRYFVNTGINTTYLALNTSRPALGKVNLRKAVNHAIDRPSLLEALSTEATKADRRPEVYVQVNIGEEEQKGGCTIAEAAAAAGDS